MQAIQTEFLQKFKEAQDAPLLSLWLKLGRVLFNNGASILLGQLHNICVAGWKISSYSPTRAKGRQNNRGLHDSPTFNLLFS